LWPGIIDARARYRAAARRLRNTVLGCFTVDTYVFGERYMCTFGLEGLDVHGIK